MTSHRTAAFLFLVSALGCTFETAGAPAEGPALEPGVLDSAAPVALPTPGPVVSAADLAAAEPEASLERAVLTGRQVRTLVHAVLRRSVEARRTEPHEVDLAVDEQGLRGRVQSASDGELRVARFWLEGTVNEHYVTIELGHTDWGTGSTYDGTVTHPEMTLELYSIHERSADGSARWGFEDAWAVRGVQYELLGGSVELRGGELTAEGELLRDGELVGGLVVDDDAVLLETPDGEIVFMPR